MCGYLGSACVCRRQCVLCVFKIMCVMCVDFILSACIHTFVHMCSSLQLLIYDSNKKSQVFCRNYIVVFTILHLC